MATVQTVNVAMKYGQRFLPAGGSAGTISVAPVPAGDQFTKVAHNQQYPPVSISKDPIILNHVLTNGGSTAVTPVLSTVTTHMQEPQQQIHQHIQQMQPPPIKMWLLVEWEAPIGEPNTYSVIDSCDLILQSESGNSRQTIQTGMTIFVRRDKRVQQATVVIISGKLRILLDICFNKL